MDWCRRSTKRQRENLIQWKKFINLSCKLDLRRIRFIFLFRRRLTYEKLFKSNENLNLGFRTDPGDSDHTDGKGKEEGVKYGRKETVSDVGVVSKTGRNRGAYSLKPKGNGPYAEKFVGRVSAGGLNKRYSRYIKLRQFCQKF